MKTLSMVLLLAASTGAYGQPADPAQKLFDTAVRDEAHGKFDQARLVLVTLATTYSDSPLAARARTEVFALDLFLDAREKQQTGHARSAFIAYRTVAQVYPESPLAQQAEATSRALEPPAKAPVIRSIFYRGFSPVSYEQIQDRLTEREVPMAVERPYDPEEVERARKVLVQLLTDKGHADLDVKVETENIPPRSIGITFTVGKK
jgi:hypothetical protein